MNISLVFKYTMLKFCNIQQLFARHFVQKKRSIERLDAPSICKGSSIYYVIIFGGLGRPLPPYVICNHLGLPPPM